jgi:gliding motility-associated-like protein
VYTCLNTPVSGSLTANVTEGTSPYSYTWSNGQHTKTIINLTAATYTVTVTDSLGCSGTASGSVVAKIDPITFNKATIVNATCNGGNNGSITTSAKGVGTINYLWNTAATTTTISGLTSGTYTVTATDSLGCSVSASYTVGQPSAITFGNPSIANVTCNNDSDGSITVIASGGTGTIKYSWSNGGKGDSIGGLKPGAYTVTATDSLGCTATATFNVTQTTGLTFGPPVITNITCNGDSTGSITASASGTGGTISYVWSTGATTATISNLPAGTYTVTASNTSGCSASASYSVTQGAPIALGTPVITEVSCFGGNNGSITVNATGGTGTLNYSWNTGGTTNTISNLIAANYQLTVTDSLGCSVTASYTVTQAKAITFGTAVIVSPACFGDSTGSITAKATGGTGVIHYVWNTGATVATITGLKAGTYTVTATDRSGCTATASYNISQPAQLVFGNPGIINVSCNGDSTGSITVSVTGGTGTITYLWNSGATTVTIGNLAAGTYTVTATDSAGCSATAQYNVSQPNAIVISNVVITNVTPCFGGNNGSISVSASGGTGTLTYLWSTGATVNTITGLIAGTYTLTVTDLSKCTATASYTVTQPAQVTFGPPVISEVGCNGDSTGSITDSASGGTGTITYIWSTGGTGPAITNLGPGVYSVTATDSLGCSASVSDSIIQVPGLTFGTPVIVNTACSQDTGSITVSVSGNTGTVTYVWNIGNTTAAITGLASGTYSVTATDSLGCSASASYTVTQISTLLFGPPVITSADCGDNDGSIQVTTTGANGTVTYVWNTTATGSLIDSLAPGAYSVTATDSLGCSASATYNVGQNSTLTFDNAIIQNVTCFGDSNGSIQVSVSKNFGSVTYVWNTGIDSSFIGGLSANSYDVTATDSLGCSVSAVYTVSEPAAVTFGTPIISNTPCSGDSSGSITVNASGGTGTITYLWNTTATTATISGLGTGTYTVTATDSLGCSASASYNITQTPGVTLGAPQITNAGCSGGATGSIIVSASGGSGTITYLWNTSSTSDTLNGLVPGTYSVTATDSLGCSASAAYTVGQNAITFGNPVITSPSCGSTNGGSILVTTTGGSGPISYVWNTGPTTNPITGIGAGVYSVTATDTTGCSASASYIINQSSSLTFANPVITVVTCNGDSNGTITALATGGSGTIAYSWNNGDSTATITGLQAGTYTVTATDTTGCSATASYNVGAPPAIIFNAPFVDSITCFGAANGSITASATGGTGTITYSWSNTATGATISNLSAAQYCVTATDSVGCSASACYTLSQPDTLVIDSTVITNANCINAGTIALTVTGGTQAYSYNWTGGISGNPATNVPAGVYAVTATDANGCTATGGPDTVISVGGVVVFDSATIVSPICNGGTGSIAVTATDTVLGGPITYSWDNGATGDTLSGVVAGTYCVTATDTAGCTASMCYTISQPPAITFGPAVLTQPNCNGDSSGCIQVSATGGTGTITYSWAGGGTSSLLCGLPAGAYTVTATDSLGCSASMTYQLGQPNAVTFANSIVDSITCNNANNGSITVSAIGGTGTITYSWNTGQTTSTISNLSAAQYCVTATDSLGCSASTCFILNNPAPLNIDSAVITPGSCVVGGSITIYASGGSGAYSYNWSDNLSGNPITNLAAGTYALTLSDANGCSITGSYQVNAALGAITFGTPTIVNPLCNGETGSITVAATDSGVGGSITYAWNTGATGASITNLSAATYCVTATDSAGCSASVCYNITQPSAVTFGSPVIVPVNCTDTASGCLTVSATGGTGTITYIWGGGQTTATICQLVAGTYQVTATDSLGCSVSTSYTLSSPPSVNINTVVTAITCNGADNGIITATATGGTGTISYSWNTLATTATISNLGPGSYCVTATDTLGCSAATCDTLVDPAAIVIQQPFTVTPATCTTGGSITVIASGGTGFLTYNWTGNLSGNPLNGVSSGLYCLTVSDVNGCTADGGCDSVTSTAVAINIDSAQINQVSCSSQGSIIVYASGGVGTLFYTWSGSNSTTDTASNLQAGFYTVTVSDSLGCSATMTYSVGTQAGSIAIVFVDTSEVTCPGLQNGSITVIAEGGSGSLSYAWSNNPNDSLGTDANLAAGTYTVTISDNAPCSISASFTITQPTPVIVDSAIVTPASCGTPGTITVVVSGGSPSYRFAWNNGAFGSPLTGLGAGTYCVVVSDSNGCSSTSADTCYTVTAIGNPISLGTPVIDSIKCSNGSTGSISVTATGGSGTITYTWGSGATTNSISNLSSGTYCVTATDTTGCSIGACYTLLNPSAIGVFTDTITPVGCTTNGYISIVDTGGTGTLSYLWSTGQTTGTISNAPAGTYGLTVTDQNGCNLTNSYTVSLGPTALLVNPANATITNVVCFGENNGAINPNIGGDTTGITYSWSPAASSPTLTNLAPGNYLLTVTNGAACSGTETLTVAGPSNPLKIDAIVTTPSCSTPAIGSACATVSGGTPDYTYSWSIDPTADSACITGIQASTFGLKVTDVNGCTASFASAIPEDILVGFGKVHYNPCTSNPLATYVLVTDSGGLGIPPYVYMIDTVTGGNVATNTTGNFSNLYEGDYFYVITDSLGCQVSEPFPVEHIAKLDSFGITARPETCPGTLDGSIEVAVNPSDSLDGPFTYSLNGDTIQTDSNYTFTGLAGGTYTVYTVNSQGCKASVVGDVRDSSNPTVTFIPDTIITANNDTVTLTPIVGGVTTAVYAWTPTTGLSCDTCQMPSATVTVSPTVYYVLVSDSANPQCKAMDSIVLIIKGQYIMPTAFTPNGDGHNDLFGPVSYSYATILAFHIYNRWGQEVHNSIDYWDGNFDGKAQPAGAYVYYIEVQYKDVYNDYQVVTKKLEGTVVLLR